MTETKILNLKYVQQEILLNGPKKDVFKFISNSDDEIMNNIEIPEKLSDGLCKFNIKVDLSSDYTDVKSTVSFLYCYIEEDPSGNIEYAITGKYTSLIGLDSTFDQEYLKNSFVKDNLKILVEPIANTITKTIYNITSDTLLYPRGIDVYSKFVEEMEKQK